MQAKIRFCGKEMRLTEAITPVFRIGQSKGFQDAEGGPRPGLAEFTKC